MKIKKIFAFLLFLTVLVGALSLSVFAEETETGATCSHPESSVTKGGILRGTGFVTHLQYYSCSDCGDSWNTEEDCNFIDGVCACGHVSADVCTHSSSVDIFESYESTSKTTHHHHKNCNLCGTVILNVVENCSFTNGSCLCGNETCVHNSTFTYYIPESSNTHKIKVVCNDCSALISFSTVNDCTFENGACIACEQTETTCSHEFEQYEEHVEDSLKCNLCDYVCVHAASSEAYEYTDSGCHVRIERCTVCGNMTDMVVIENCTFVNGTCSVCNYTLESYPSDWGYINCVNGFNSVSYASLKQNGSVTIRYDASIDVNCIVEINGWSYYNHGVDTYIVEIYEGDVLVATYDANTSADLYTCTMSDLQTAHYNSIVNKGYTPLGNYQTNGFWTLKLDLSQFDCKILSLRVFAKLAANNNISMQVANVIGVTVPCNHDNTTVTYESLSSDSHTVITTCDDCGYISRTTQGCSVSGTKTIATPVTSTTHNEEIRCLCGNIRETREDVSCYFVVDGYKCICGNATSGGGSEGDTEGSESNTEEPGDGTEASEDPTEEPTEDSTDEPEDNTEAPTSCEHVNTAEYSCVSNGDGTHNYYDVCDDCGEMITRSLNSPCLFDDDICLACGYENHVHAFVLEVALDEFCVVKGTCSTMAAYKKSCSCGISFDPTSDAYTGSEYYFIGEYGDHTYEDGICTLCGAEGTEAPEDPTEESTDEPLIDISLDDIKVDFVPLLFPAALILVCAIVISSLRKSNRRRRR